MKHVDRALRWVFSGLLLVSSVFFAGPVQSAISRNTMAPLIGIRINNGDRYTNGTEVDVEVKSLKTPDELIDEMQIGTDPQLEDARWQPYSRETIVVTLESGDGEKRIFVRLKDKAGNLSPIESNRIILDTSPPENCKIVVNKGAQYSNDNLGRVLVNAYADGAASMIISNHEDLSKSKWENYVRSKKWILDISSEGERFIYARFKDPAGNESEIVSTSIVHDTSAPDKGEIVINDGHKYTNSSKVAVKLRSENAVHVRLVSRNTSETHDYSPGEDGWMRIRWQLDSVEGLKSVRAYFFDEAGNRSPTPAEATIIYKFSGPKAPVVVLNNGQKHTNNSKGTVDVKITPREKTENWRVAISNDPEMNDNTTIPFTSIIPDWELSGEEDGLKRVYVRLIDEAGNSSETTSAEIILDRTPPVVHRFLINDGAAWTNSLKVSLYFDVQDGEKVQISNTANMSPKGNWEKYEAVRNDWPLLPTDGRKTVYARFMDAAGNTSEMVSASIQLDGKPPVGGIMINDGDRVTNDPEGVVQLKVKFEEDAMGMQIGNTPSFDSIKVAPVLPLIENWTLDGEDGPKSVFMRLQDKAGNFSQVYTASIILDRMPPEACSITINNDDEWVTNRNHRVSLSLRAEGARSMLISQNASFENAEWMPFKTALAWTLEGPEGMHEVFAKFKDQAGNESMPVSASIRSDFTPPVVNLFAIDNGAQYTSDPQKKVGLKMEVEDAEFMALSHAPMRDTIHATSLWEPYIHAKDWILEGEDGLKMVHAFFKDQAGNITAEYSAKIVLDRVPPSELGFAINKGAEWFNDPEGNAHLQLHASGAAEMMLSNEPGFKGATWQAYATEIESWKLDLSEAEAKVYVRFRDEAGNVSETVTSTISIDIDPPAHPAISINDGDPYVYNKERQITLDLTVEDAQYMRISRNAQFEDARWEPLAEEKVIILAEPDGKKTFYAQFRDEAGNDSEIVRASIILDTAPPVVRAFTINDGQEWTNDQDKKVTLKIDGEGASDMMISEKVSFEDMDWQPYVDRIEEFELPGEDGEKNLWVVLKDEAGNVSKPAHARIMLKRAF